VFIRKRTYIGKRGASETYQVLESYRQDGKVRQRRIVNLGWCATPQEALDVARRHLETVLELNSPRSAHLEAKRLTRIEKLRAQIAVLENVVAEKSTAGDVFDTTTAGCSVRKCNSLAPVQGRAGGAE
jgi:hypothetical protein